MLKHILDKKKALFTYIWSGTDWGKRVFHVVSLLQSNSLPTKVPFFGCFFVFLKAVPKSQKPKTKDVNSPEMPPVGVFLPEPLRVLLRLAATLLSRRSDLADGGLCHVWIIRAFRWSTGRTLDPTSTCLIRTGTNFDRRLWSDRSLRAWA